MILTDELCDKLCAAAREKSKEMGIYISKMDYPGHTIVTEKHWFSVSFWYQGRPITQCETKDVAACSGEGGSLMAIQTNDPKITAREYP